MAAGAASVWTDCGVLVIRCRRVLKGNGIRENGGLGSALLHALDQLGRDRRGNEGGHVATVLRDLLDQRRRQVGVLGAGGAVANAKKTSNPFMPTRV